MRFVLKILALSVSLIAAQHASADAFAPEVASDVQQNR